MKDMTQLRHRGTMLSALVRFRTKNEDFVLKMTILY